MWFALALPALALVAVGATELAVLETDRKKLQDAADAAALMGADQLSFASHDGVAERAKAYALGQVAQLRERATVTAAAAVEDEGGSLRVTLVSNRMSFFGNLVPPGGFTTTVDAVATSMAKRPLCVLGLNRTVGKVVNMLDTATMQAPGCLVHSNDDMVAESSSKLVTATAQAVGSTSGMITPAPNSGAEVLDDPFATRLINLPVCAGGLQATLEVGLTNATQVVTLNGGPTVHHCRDVIVHQDATLVLGPGEHRFYGKLEAKQRAKIVAPQGSTLFFHKNATLKLNDSSSLDLVGSKTGQWAGMLIVAARDHTNTFELPSQNVKRLEGVIYLPSAKLLVTGNTTAAEESNWTVSVTKEIQVKGSPTLVINVNYDRSEVPVPVGVGSNTAGLKLTH